MKDWFWGLVVVVLGLAIGVTAGLGFPVVLPSAFAHYLSIALLAALDSAFGGMRAGMERRFDSLVFMTGLLSNAILAGGLTYVGDKMGVPLYDAALFAFGFRIFQNLASIRHLLIQRLRDRRQGSRADVAPNLSNSGSQWQEK